MTTKSPIDATPTEPELPARQLECLLFIDQFWRQHRGAPSHLEIAEAMSYHSNNARAFVDPLEKKGFIRRIPGRQRNIKITEKGAEFLRRLRTAHDDSKGHASAESSPA